MNRAIIKNLRSFAIAPRYETKSAMRDGQIIMPHNAAYLGMRRHDLHIAVVPRRLLSNRSGGGT